MYNLCTTRREGLPLIPHHDDQLIVKLLQLLLLLQLQQHCFIIHVSATLFQLPSFILLLFLQCCYNWIPQQERWLMIELEPTRTHVTYFQFHKIWENVGGTSCQIWWWFVKPKRTLNFERTRGKTVSTMTGLSLLPFLISAHCCSFCNGIHLSNQDASIFVSRDPYMSIYIKPISCATLTV